MKKPKEFITSNGFLLEEGKEYLWSGVSDNLYTCLEWIDVPIKIRKVFKDKVEIYDVCDNKVFTIDNNYIKQDQIKFKAK